MEHGIVSIFEDCFAMTKRTITVVATAKYLLQLNHLYKQILLLIKICLMLVLGTYRFKFLEQTKQPGDLAWVVSADLGAVAGDNK